MDSLGVGNNSQTFGISRQFSDAMWTILREMLTLRGRRRKLSESQLDCMFALYNDPNRTSDVTVNDLCERFGIKRASFYKYLREAIIKQKALAEADRPVAEEGAA